MNIVERVKNILLKPKEEWVVIEGETTSVQELYLNYIIILSAIPAVAGFIGMSLIGMQLPFVGSYRVPLVTGVATMIFSFVMSLVMTYVIALITDAVAPSFGGTKNPQQSLKLAAYSYTAYWLAGIFQLIPLLAILGIVGLYSVYLYYLGAIQLMKVPKDKAVGFTVVMILISFVMGIVVGTITGILTAPKVL